MTGKQKILLAGLAAIVAALSVVAFSGKWFPGSEATPPRQLADDVAPDFALNDLDGVPFRLSGQLGRPVLLVFGATWCPACQEQVPRLKEIHARYAGSGLVMVGINIQESREKVSVYARKHGLPYRTLLDEDAAVAKRYGVRGIPAMILLDDRGRIIGGQRLIDQSLAALFERAPAAPSSPR